MSGLGDALADVRTDDGARRAALLLAAGIGLVAATYHWLGFFVGGALVGLVSTDLKWALVAGVAFGFFAWVAFVLVLVAGGAFAAYAATGQLFTVSVAIPVVAAAVGALVRGIG